MKTVAALLCIYYAAVSAAPAVVWKNGSDGKTMHHSDDVSAKNILPEQGVVFFINRMKDGSESLSALAQEGKLPQTAAQYESAHCIHHHVSGVTSAHLLARAVPESTAAVEVTLEEYINLHQVIESLAVAKNTGKVAMKNKKRARALKSADLFFVTVDESEAAAADKAIAAAISSAPAVVLTAARSFDEVKRERDLSMSYRMKMQREAGRHMLLQNSSRRRLEEDGNQENADNQQEDQENQNGYSNTVLVSMTPNIMSGILFTILFATITMIGFSCMGGITGQDVYVNKMPSIGREA